MPRVKPPTAAQLLLLASVDRPGHLWQARGGYKRKGEPAFLIHTVKACLDAGWLRKCMVSGHHTLALTDIGAVILERGRAKNSMEV